MDQEPAQEFVGRECYQLARPAWACSARRRWRPRSPMLRSSAQAGSSPQARAFGRRHRPRLRRDLAWLVDDQGIEPHIPVFDKSGRQDGTFSRADFAFDLRSPKALASQSVASISQSDKEFDYHADVVMLGLGPVLADAHVLDHPLTQRAYRYRGHRSLLSAGMDP